MSGRSKGAAAGASGPSTAASSSSSGRERVVDASQHPGFVNLGNTCFLNSALQAISATQTLRELYMPNEDIVGLVSDLMDEQHKARSGSATPLLSNRRLPNVHDTTQTLQRQADIAELIAARCKSPVLRLADEEHGRIAGNGHAISRPPSAGALEASIRAVTNSGIVANPTPADIASMHGSLNDSKASPSSYEPKVADLPLNTAFRRVLEKSWKSSMTGQSSSSLQPSGKVTTTKTAPVNPKSLLNAISRKYEHYSEFRQQDGHELLRHLLDALRMEEVDVIKKLKPPTKKDGNLQNNHEGDNDSGELIPLVDNLFCGKLLSAVVCEGCRQVSHTYEDFYDISLSLRNDSDTASMSKRQRLRSMAEKWRRPVAKNGDEKPISDTLMALRNGELESMSDTEQSDDLPKRSSSRLGRAINRPRSAADSARIDANSKEGSKTFIKKQVHADETGIETDVEGLSLTPGRRTPSGGRARLSSGGGATSLLRAVSGRRTPSQSRSSSPSIEAQEKQDLSSESSCRPLTSFHRRHDSKGRGNRQQQYLSRILTETMPAPQQANLSALLWGRRTYGISPERSRAGAASNADEIEAIQASTGLVRALHQFTGVEVLDGTNSYACKRCWRLLNPPSEAVREKHELRRLRRGKKADDSEESGDDESSSDEEEKERKQRSSLSSHAAGSESSLSSVMTASSNSISEGEAQQGRADMLEKSVSSAITVKDQEAGKTPIAPTTTPLVNVTSHGSESSASVRSNDVSDQIASGIENPKPRLQAPKAVKASLSFGPVSSDENSGTLDSSEDEPSDVAGTDAEESGLRQRSIRYADDQQSSANAKKEANGMHQNQASNNRKRSSHSLQRRALKRYLIAETPKVLVFHFKRFQATGRTFGSFSSNFKKIDDYVSFPEYLDVRQWVAPPREEYSRHGHLKASSDARALAEAEASAEPGAEQSKVAMSKQHKYNGIWQSDRPDSQGHHHRRHRWTSLHGRHHRMTKESQSNITPGRTIYRLYAVVVHQGSMSGGHYTAYVLSDRATAPSGDEAKDAGEKQSGERTSSAVSNHRSDGSDAKAKLATRSSLSSDHGTASEKESGSAVPKSLDTSTSTAVSQTNRVTSDNSISSSNTSNGDGNVASNDGEDLPIDIIVRAPSSEEEQQFSERPTDAHLPVANDGTTDDQTTVPSSPGTAPPVPTQPTPSARPSTLSEKRDNRQWVFASDSLVRAASIDEVLKAQAYMLFYEQV